MILSCPACAIQFLIDPNALGASGRRVRCAKCKHEWLATRPIITVPDETVGVSEHKIIAEAPGAAITKPVLSKEMRHVSQRNALIGGFLLALLCVIPLFFMGKGKGEAKKELRDATPVVEAPMIEKVVALDGTPSTLLKEEQGRMILTIEGALINRSDSRKKVPRLKAEALNAMRKVVREWTIPLTAEDLEPGQRLPFTFTAPFVEQGVVDIAFHLL